MKRFGGLLILIALVAGCGAPRPVSAPPPFVEEAPPVSAEPRAPAEPQAPKVGCFEQSGWPGAPSAAVSSRDGIWVRSGACALQVAEESFYVSFTLPAAVGKEGALAGLRTTLKEQPKTQVNPNGDRLDLAVFVDAGQPGERFEVRWQGEAGTSTLALGYQFERLPSPRVTAEVQVGSGGWQPLTNTLVIPAGPLAFRFRLLNGVDPDGFRTRVKDALNPASFHLAEAGPDTFVVTVPAPPSLVKFDFLQLPALHGKVPMNGFAVYVGEAPRLVALDPASGREELVGPAPPDIRAAEISPDGRWAMLFGMGGAGEWEDRIWVLDTVTGKAAETPFRADYWGQRVFWVSGKAVYGAPDRMQVWDLAAGRGEVYPSQARHWGPVSPDGRLIAGYAWDWEREDPELRAPASLVLLDLQSGKEEIFPDVVKVRIPHSEAPVRLPMRWQSGGKGLILGEHTGYDQEKAVTTWRYFRLEIATGDVAPYTAAETPVEVRYQTWTAGPGPWEIYQRSNWDEVRLRGPGGAEKTFGYGLPLGWGPDGRLLVIRWNPSIRRWRHGM